MDKLRAMRTFVAIADAGSLTAAARAEGSSLPAVVRLLAALEEELGVRLVQRSTRRLALTPVGRAYLERCRAVLALIEEADAELHADQHEPRGTLRVTAPVLFGQRHVARGVTAFVQRHPQLSVELTLADRVQNLLEEGVDVAIRIGSLEDSSLIARRVGEMRRVTVAAPSYLAQRGVPEHPLDLLAHNCVRYYRPGAPGWPFRVDGAPLVVPVSGNYSVDQSAAAAEACVAGLGIGSFLAYQVAPHVANGSLRLLLEPFETTPRPIHVVYPEARHMPARTRAFLEFIIEHIAGERPAWQPQPPSGAKRAKPRARRAR